MVKVNKVDKKTMMTHWDIVKYQLLTHCYLYKIQISDSELDCVAHLAIEGEHELTSFCNVIHDKKIFSSPQSVRNCLTKLEKKGLIVKEGKNKKKITVNSVIGVQTQGNILLDFKFLSVAS